MLCIYAFEIGEFINHFYSFRSRNQSLLSAPEEGGGGKSLKSVSLLSWSMDMVSQGGRGGEGAWEGGKPVVGHNHRSLNTPPIYFCVLFVLFSGRCAYERQLFWIRLKIHAHKKTTSPHSKKKGKKMTVAFRLYLYSNGIGHQECAVSDTFVNCGCTLSTKNYL